MRHGSLFSGIGGFDLAAEWMGWENVFACEIDEWNRNILKQNHPNTEIHGDIKQFDGTQYTGRIDVLSGGFPCQPFSLAGKREGKDDARYLWPEMLRVIREVGPAYVVGENVGGSWFMVDEICSDLERLGYTAEPVSIEAAGVGADHKRERFWFMAYSHSIRSQRGKQWLSEGVSRRNPYVTVLPPLPLQLHTTKDYIPEPYVIGGAHGIPDRAHRIKALGNSIVPQVAYEIFKAIDNVSKVI